MLKGSFNRLQASIQTVKGIGPATAAKLRARLIETLEDALLFLPVRYLDRSRLTPLGQLRPGQEAVVAGRVVKLGQGRPGPRRPFTLTLADDSGQVQAVWFGLGQRLAQSLKPDQELILAGRPAVYQNGLALHHPEIIASLEETADLGRFIPVYRAIPGLSPRRFRRVVKKILEADLGRLDSPLPAEVVQAQGLLDLAEAFRRVHFPQSADDADPAGLPRRTLIFTELFLFQAGLALSRQEAKRAASQPLPLFDQARARVAAGLPFRLTQAQERVLDEIGRDLAQSRPMHRLLQGDVGSGKTVVAGVCLLAAALAGRQAALLAPTELLAEQHGQTLTALIQTAGVTQAPVALLTSATPEPERAACLEALAQGRPLVVVGTQALLQDRVVFANLGLAVIDEQHRFGLNQRAGLVAKGDQPHLLSLTATPIPRSLALVLYGDLDLSVLDEKPPGRQPIVTRVLPSERIERAWRAVANAAGQGLQSFIVLPAVASEKLASAEARFRELRERLPELRLALVHGRLDKSEQARVMARFRAGEIDAVVATTVVEVGLDAPRAAVMVVEQAERFGLAQLHQLRGRVGRGGSKAACLLLSSAEAAGRLKSLERTEDGFALAEADLAERGPGDFVSTRQSGWPDFRLADLLTDARLLDQARRAAQELLDHDPGLAAPDHRPLADLLDRRWLRRLRLGRAG